MGHHVSRSKIGVTLRLPDDVDLPLFGVRLKYDGHEIPQPLRLRFGVPGIDDDVLNPSPVSDRAAPSVAVDRHLDGNLGFAPNISRVERHRGVCTSVRLALISVQLRFELVSHFPCST